MTTLKNLILLVIVLLSNAGSLFAHALWIETSTVGKAGQKQTVKIIYAEPDDKPEKLGDWYSDVKEFELWLIAPDKQKTKLATVAAEDHFTSEFTPRQDGVYTLTISKAAKELGGSTIYQFNASAIIKVGKSLTGNEASFNENEISVFADASGTFRTNQSVNVTTRLKNKPAEKMEVSIASPSGWNRHARSDAGGAAEFVPVWPGTYKIEASASEKAEGDHFGKPYKSIWRSATLLIDVQ
ncbi:DUF4198 domain-containing protein [Dyadobacter sediminis]|uniref:DUF4198 domain-containing protein n=1 Tax=Dyadobacter sediminis TaxID=1493691 RepID=A0A5R9KBP1_9BACT|nr:DUF4198 domain-containing protein [Dyadobacter sediminis]TLU92178.1 DUF4198 domain-containing protein [Dyadobacter sediminis]GGB96767.1 hypothetical protein GCM10011325_25120 [Dyadobacter sediminis]